ncbi:nitrogen regulation protein [bacterium BMS3Bbin06]|nr:nitrogen regulation protein [bacterium BMS3Abin08]GBE34762.1 nitrogen regulation protein [bacterium BMS3Bbin06]
MSVSRDKILVVDDQRAVCYSLKRFLSSEGFHVETAISGEEALKKIESLRPDVVIMDVRMPELGGLEALAMIKESHSKVQVIMMTAYSTTEKAIEAMKLGAYDYLVKPFDNDELLRLIKDALRTRAMMEAVVSFDEWEESVSGEKIIGKSQEMLDIYKQLGRIAPTDASVLILGESGTGKELIARAVYHHSNRSNKPFLTINCAAIPEQLLESELFGYERGAFTGADFKRLGKFEQCSGGTIFLDEIGDMPLSIQAKLLRVLQDGRFQRLGGSETIETDVRIIAATNKNLESMVEENTFREDLYFRINVVAVRVPSLRERREDIRELVHYFIQKYNRVFKKEIKGLTSDTLKRLEEYSWPGNVRELENAVQKAMVLCKSDYLSIKCCEGLSMRAAENPSANLAEAVKNLAVLAFENGSNAIFQDLISRIERELIRKALDQTRGNQVQASRLLGISRNTLRKKLNIDG